MLNHIVLMGRLTRDPEMRTTNSGIPVTSFTIAVDRDYAANGAERETDFVDCVAWRSTAEFVSKYFRKGQMAVASGRLVSRKYQDRNGNNRTVWEVVAESVYFGEARRDSAQQSQSYSAPPRPNNPTAPSGGVNVPSPSRSAFTELDDDDGDLPF